MQIPAHTYKNMRIELDTPSLDFGKSNHTRGLDTNATEPYTTDDGKTWFIDTSKQHHTNPVFL